MNYKLIMLPNPILVSDEEKQIFDRVWNSYVEKILRVSEVFMPHGNKIIAGIEGLPSLDLSAIAEEIGLNDESILLQALDRSITSVKLKTKGRVTGFIDGFYEGFKAAQSLNEKKFSEGDLEDFYIWKDEERWFGFSDGKWNYTFEHPTSVSKDSYEKNYRKTTKELLDMWKQQRKPKEYNVLYTQEGNTIKVTKILN